MINERRSGRDRRNLERSNLSIDIQWEGLLGRKSGTLCDISADGCFILCSGEVKDGESVKIFLPLSDGMKVQFWGKVANHILEIGFAARFSQLSDAQVDFLEKFIDGLEKE